jgi:hypothetical protein
LIQFRSRHAGPLTLDASYCSNGQEKAVCFFPFGETIVSHVLSMSHLFAYPSRVQKGVDPLRHGLCAVIPQAHVLLLVLAA